MRLTKSGEPDGRSGRATGRNQQLATRVTPQFHARVKAVGKRDGLMLVEVLERGLDAYETLRNGGQPDLPADPALATALDRLDAIAGRDGLSAAALLELMLQAHEAGERAEAGEADPAAGPDLEDLAGMTDDPVGLFQKLWAEADIYEREAMARITAEAVAWQDDAGGKKARTARKKGKVERPEEDEAGKGGLFDLMAPKPQPTLS